MANGKQDELDRILDAALEKYAAAEPREGLEGRVLANLRAERARVLDRAWWRWGVMAALAAIVIVAVTFAWRSGKPSHPVVANRPSATRSAPKEGRQVVSNGDEKEVRPQKRSARRSISVRRSQLKDVIAANRELGPPKMSLPKLDQFPSPHPLSEQEKILANYIAQYPEHAALIAQARTEALRRDRAEEMRDAAGNEPDSQR
jgi:hypothetical protein